MAQWSDATRQPHSPMKHLFPRWVLYALYASFFLSIAPWEIHVDTPAGVLPGLAFILLLGTATSFPFRWLCAERNIGYVAHSAFKERRRQKRKAWIEKWNQVLMDRRVCKENGWKRKTEEGGYCADYTESWAECIKRNQGEQTPICDAPTLLDTATNQFVAGEIDMAALEKVASHYYRSPQYEGRQEMEASSKGADARNRQQMGDYPPQGSSADRWRVQCNNPDGKIRDLCCRQQANEQESGWDGIHSFQP